MTGVVGSGSSAGVKYQGAVNQGNLFTLRECWNDFKAAQCVAE